jgi:hypothetical protein
MEAAPSASFEVGKAQFGFEFFVVALDAPAQLGPIDETGKLDILGQAREPVFGRFGFILGPIASSHSRGWDITFLQSRAATRTRKLAKREVRSAFDPSRQARQVRDANAAGWLRARSLAGKGGAQLATIAIGGIGQHDAGRNSISQCGMDLN